MTHASTTRRLGVAAAIAAAVALAFGLLAPVARAAVWGDEGRTASLAEFQGTLAGGTATGCTGSATSLDENGEAIDSAAAPGSPPPTRGNALKIDYDGVVSYDGQTNALIKDHTWDISIFGIPVKTGGDTNDEERTTDDSNEKVSDYIPLRVSGKYYVSFNFSGTGGSCIGSLWVEIDENPVGTIPWVVGAGFLLVGVAGLAFAIPTGAAALGAATTAAAAAGAVSAAGAAPTAPPPDDAVIGGDTPPPDNGQVIGDSGGDAEGDPPGGNDDDSTVIGG